ncbi:storkhead-box protein 1-like [Myxocyprinus asiaticus]|uniref:storkhead-box protein 1-like n=1 Tax=Myxocyprinus asiaticus TaxID=70543 RepID=UPI0022228985|nr:storkhead-box protein 1-like [Myxocyprinus asiaticus]
MSLQQRAVQLSAASLAVILSRDEDTKCSASSTSGQDVFADFKAQNSRSFWNKRLVKAVAEVYFQGWLKNYVLLVQGNANNLEVLREAWMRRALRSPKGYIIKAVGDLSPVQMSPISQSQFIPLSEILCSVISDMNAAHVVVNQEALINHMMKAHPGMTIPTQDILYNALGTLIKERKIYHTGEGYFVVTPQTYFITNNMVNERNWWSTGDNDLPSPPPITYLVSNESCMETSTDVPVMAHCRSCSCFTPPSNVPPSVQDHESINISECTGKSLKWPREHKPSVQHQSTSTAADYQASEISKSTTTSRKDKEKAGRKFGLNLFRRNTGKKENKLKKEYATYSGQFPPEEWPVRDEDDLNNLPRDLEHAIIKRINPELTVDNLVRHTVLMKKLEGKAEKGTEKDVDRGISTEALVSKQRHNHSKVGGKKSVPRATCSKKRGPSSKEKQWAKSKTLPCVENVEADDLILSRLRPELGLDEPDNQEECTILNSKCVYKKRIENPFLGLPGRDMEPNIIHKEQRREAKNPITRRRERTGHRSKSWDPHRAKAIADSAEKSHMLMDTPCEHLHERALTVDSTLDAKPIKELCGDYSSVYPDTSTLRIDDKIKLRENKVRSKEIRNVRVKEIKHNALQDGDLRNVSDQKNIVDHPTPSCDATEVPLSWPKPTIQRRLSLHILKSKEESHHRPDLLSSHLQAGDMTSSQQLSDGQTLHRNTSQTESEVYTDDDHGIYQKLEEDEHGCSSLCLNEECVLDCELSQTSIARCREPVCLDGDWDGNFIEEHAFTTHPEPTRTTQRQHEYRWQSSDRQSLPLLQKGASPRQEAQGLGKRLHKTSLGDVEPTEALENSIFDYCQTSEVESDAETLHKSADEADGKSSHWICHPKLKDCHQNTLKTSEDAGNIHNASINDHAGACAGETAESQSNTADSGIDSPRTHISLNSSNSAILKGLKHRGFLQNLEKLHSTSNSIHPPSSLLKLTPVMNV